MKKVLNVLLVLMPLFLMACGGAPKEPTSPPPAMATNTPVVRPTNTPVPVQPSPTPKAAEAEEYSFSQAANLSALKTYRVHYSMRWESVKEGKKETGSWEVMEEVVKEPAAHRVVWTNVDEEGKTSTLEFIQIGKDIYMNTGSGWMAMTSAETDIFEGNPWLSDPFGAISGNRGKLVERNVVVNGVPTNRYAFDESTVGNVMGLGAVAKAKGDVWVSTQFDVAVKYVAHYEGKDFAIGGGEEGVLDVAFDLMDINKPITIEPPAGVKPAMPEDIPAMDDAMELGAAFGMITYKTNKDVQTVTAFYETQMPIYGWTKGESAIPGFLSFTKGERTAQVMIQTEEGKTTVAIMTGE
ncbi:MAG: hypothetical protein QXP01_08265 [Candidatus Hadarchaeum sp.]